MKLHVFNDTDELSLHVAEWIFNYITKTLQQQDRFSIVLSGGNTPKKLYGLLVSEKYKNKIDWSKLHIFFGDERYVPFDDERNNAKMAYDNLLNFVSVPASQIHVMRTDIPPQESADEYEKILRQYFSFTADYSPLTTHLSPLTFDLVLLGMGDDGHTLSLFPGTSVIHEKEKWCTYLWLAQQNMYRITLTASIVNQSSCVAFLVTGNNKAKALCEVLKGEYNPDKYPSQIIQPVNGELHWFGDAAAAGELGD